MIKFCCSYHSTTINRYVETETSEEAREERGRERETIGLGILGTHCRKGIQPIGATMIPHLPQLQPHISTWFGDPSLLGDPPDSTHWS